MSFGVCASKSSKSFQELTLAFELREQMRNLHEEIYFATLREETSEQEASDKFEFQMLEKEIDDQQKHVEIGGNSRENETPRLLSLPEDITSLSTTTN